MRDGSDALRPVAAPEETDPREGRIACEKWKKNIREMIATRDMCQSRPHSAGWAGEKHKVSPGLRIKRVSCPPPNVVRVLAFFS